MYRNANYVADQVLPPLPVGKRSNKYFVYRREDYMSSSPLDANGRPMSLRQSGAEAAEIDMSLSAQNYYGEEYAYRGLVHRRGSGDCRQPPAAGYGSDRAADGAPAD